MFTGPRRPGRLLEQDEQGLIEGRGRLYLWILVQDGPERRHPDADPLAVRLVQDDRLAGAGWHGLLRLSFGDHDERDGTARRVAAPALPRLL